MLEGAKLIGAGAATIASAGAAFGIFYWIHSRNPSPSLAKQVFGYAILGFAFIFLFFFFFNLILKFNILF